MGRLKKKLPSDVKDDIHVKGDVIRNLFIPQMAKSTFHDQVNSGKILKSPKLHGYYLYNATRVNLGLPELESSELKKMTAEDVSTLSILMDALIVAAGNEQALIDVYSFVDRPDSYSDSQMKKLRKYYNQHFEPLKRYSTVLEKLAYISGALSAQKQLSNR